MIIIDDLMKSAAKLFLSLPIAYTSNERRAFVLHAGLPSNLMEQINFEGAPAVVFYNLVQLLFNYGKLSDERYALDALLEAAKDFTGKDRQKEINYLLNHLKTYRQQERPDKFSDSFHATITQVTVIIERDILEFTPAEQASFVLALSRLVNVNPDHIRILHITSGSIVLTLEMPKDSAKVLISLFLQRNLLLSELLVSKIELKHSNQTSTPLTTSMPVTKDLNSSVNSSTDSHGRLSDTINYENSVFISYAWGGESERTVNELERAFSERGINIVRDKRDLGYKGSIEEFEQRISRGQCVVLVISDKYLRSEHCMYELVEVAKNRNLRERVFPIVLSDAKIYRAIDRLNYIKHWEEQIEQLNQAIKQIDVMTNLVGINADLDKYARIRASFDHLIDLLSDMNALTPDIHEESGFSSLIDAVEHTIAKK